VQAIPLSAPALRKRLRPAPDQRHVRKRPADVDDGTAGLIAVADVGFG